MAVNDIIDSPDAQAFAASLATHYGITQDAAQAAMASLLPSLVSGVEHAGASGDGLATLMDKMAAGHYQNLIDNPALVGHPNMAADGNAIIAHLLPQGLPAGTLQTAANQSGVPAQLMGGMAPAIAVFLIGWLFRNSGGMLGNIVSSALGGAAGGGVMPHMPSMPGARPMGGGIMGWIIRFLVMRYGMVILRGLVRNFMPKL